jgi:hypothetical protein
MVYDVHTPSLGATIKPVWPQTYYKAYYGERGAGGWPMSPIALTLYNGDKAWAARVSPKVLHCTYALRSLNNGGTWNYFNIDKPGYHHACRRGNERYGRLVFVGGSSYSVAIKSFNWIPDYAYEYRYYPDGRPRLTGYDQFTFTPRGAMVCYEVSQDAIISIVEKYGDYYYYYRSEDFGETWTGPIALFSDDEYKILQGGPYKDRTVDSRAIKVHAWGTHVAVAAVLSPQQAGYQTYAYGWEHWLVGGEWTGLWWNAEEGKWDHWWENSYVNTLRADTLVMVSANSGQTWSQPRVVRRDYFAGSYMYGYGQGGIAREITTAPYPGFKYLDFYYTSCDIEIDLALTNIGTTLYMLTSLHKIPCTAHVSGVEENPPGSGVYHYTYAIDPPVACVLLESSAGWSGEFSYVAELERPSHLLFNYLIARNSEDGVVAYALGIDRAGNPITGGDLYECFANGALADGLIAFAGGEKVHSFNFNFPIRLRYKVAGYSFWW